MTTRRFGLGLLGGSFPRLLAALHYRVATDDASEGSETGRSASRARRGGRRAPRSWRGTLAALGRWALESTGHRRRLPKALYLEALEQRQLFSVFQITGSRDASDAHLYHLALSTDSPSINSWTIQWADGSQPQTLAGDTQTVDHTFTNLTAPVITATAVDDDGVHVLALVSPSAILGSLAATAGHYNFLLNASPEGVVSLSHANASDPALIGTVMAWAQSEISDPAVSGEERLAVQVTVPAQGDLALQLTPVTQLQQTRDNTVSSRLASSNSPNRLTLNSLESMSTGGFVEREFWKAPGYDVSDLTGYGTYQSDTPDQTTTLNSLEFVDEYPPYYNGSRVQGYITCEPHRNLLT